jgi:hypothetical protein
MKGKQKRTLEQITIMARWFILLQTLGVSAKKAAFYVGYVMDDTVSQTTLLRYAEIAERKAINDAI